MNDSTKTTVTVSPEGFETLASLKSMGFFETELAAFLATASLAIALGLEPEELPSGSSTKWNKGSGDIAGWLKLAPHLLTIGDPLKGLERYGQAGLRHVAERLRANDTFADIYLAKS